MFEAAVALIAVVLAVALLLAIPVRLVIRVERTDRLRATGRVRWLFGLIDAPLSGARTPRRRRTRAKKTSAAFGRVPSGAVAAIRTPGLARRAARLVGDLRRQVHGEDVYLRAQFGLDDPADTGRVYGALAPVLAVAAGRGWHVRCEPCFTGPCLAGTGGATLRVRPLSILGILTGFVLSVPVLRALFAMRPWR